MEETLFRLGSFFVCLSRTADNPDNCLRGQGLCSRILIQNNHSLYVISRLKYVK